jgi:hypothetical protein
MNDDKKGMNDNYKKKIIDGRKNKKYKKYTKHHDNLDARIIDIYNSIKSPYYKTTINDCVTCIKYLKDYNMYEGQHIGIMKYGVPGFTEFPEGSYVLFTENKRLGSPKDLRYIVEKPKTKEHIRENISNYLNYEYELGFISHKLNNVPAELVKDVVIQFH